MSTANRVIKNTGFLYAKMGITMFISLYTTRLILNALGAEDFGIFNIVGGAIAMLGFLNAAMAGATQRFMSYTEGEGNKEKQKSIFNISFVLHIAIAGIMAVVLLIAGYFFFNGILNISPERILAAKVVYASLIVSTVFTVMTVPYDAVLNAHENMLYYSIVGIIESVFKLIVALLVVAYGGDKLILYGLLMAVIPLITMSIMRLYCHRKYEECVIAPRQYWNKSIVKEFSMFAGWNLLGVASNMTANTGQGIVMNMFFGTKVNAAQGIAGQINGQLSSLTGILMKALNPVITKSEGAGNREQMLTIVYTGSKLSFFMLIIFYIPFMIETKYILKLWLKTVPEYTVIFCRLFFLRSLIEQNFISLSSSISAVGKIKKYQIFNSILSLFPLIICYFLFQYGFKPYWNYIVFVIYTVFSALIALQLSNSLYKLSISDYLKNIILRCWIIFIIITLFSLIPYVLMNESLIRLILVLFISSIIFIISVWFFGLNKSEKYQINLYINYLKKQK